MVQPLTTKARQGGSLATMSMQKPLSRRGSPLGVNLEQERLYLQKASDQLRRCQITLFRYQKSVKQGQGGISLTIPSLASGPQNSKQSTSRNIYKDKLRTQGDAIRDTPSEDYLSKGLY